MGELHEVDKSTWLGSDGQEYEVVELEPRGQIDARGGSRPTHGLHQFYVPALRTNANMRKNGTLWFQSSDLTLTRTTAAKD